MCHLGKLLEPATGAVRGGDDDLGVLNASPHVLVVSVSRQLWEGERERVSVSPTTGQARTTGHCPRAITMTRAEVTARMSRQTMSLGVVKLHLFLEINGILSEFSGDGLSLCKGGRDGGTEGGRERGREEEDGGKGWRTENSPVLHRASFVFSPSNATCSFRFRSAAVRSRSSSDLR